MPCASDPMPSDLDMARWNLRMLSAEIDSIDSPGGRKEYREIVKSDTTRPLYPGDATESDVNELTNKLCQYLKYSNEAHILSLSLEVQIWWRDHQETDNAQSASPALRVKAAYKFPNGNWAAFDFGDEQIPDLQKLSGYSTENWKSKAVELGYDISECAFNL